MAQFLSWPRHFTVRFKIVSFVHWIESGTRGLRWSWWIISVITDRIDKWFNCGSLFHISKTLKRKLVFALRCSQFNVADEVTSELLFLLEIRKKMYKRSEKLQLFLQTVMTESLWRCSKWLLHPLQIWTFSKVSSDVVVVFLNCRLQVSGRYRKICWWSHEGQPHPLSPYHFKSKSGIYFSLIHKHCCWKATFLYYWVHFLHENEL